MNNKPKIFFILIGIILFLLLLFSVIFSLININNPNILKGITVNGLDISNMSKNEAVSYISGIIQNKSSNNISLLSNDFEKVVTFESLEIDYNVSSTINTAFNVGRSGNIFENNFEILDAILNQKDIQLDLHLNDDKLNQLMLDIEANLPNRLIQSSYYIEDDNLIITKGTSGDTVDSKNFTTQLYNSLNNLSLDKTSINIPIKQTEPNIIDIEQIYKEIYKDAQNAYYEKNPLKIHAEVIGVSFDKENALSILKEDANEYTITLQYTYPEITINDLDIDIFKDKLSYFSTKYDISNSDRSTNLELAASKIDGFILAPGETFSYNKIVGARTIAAGYKEAKVYSNGQVVDGIGGGICQISSTLYNSVVMANLDIKERHNHQFVTSYVPAGRDATVVYGAKDLKFVNSRSYPIKIEMNVANGVATCSIYGLKEDTDFSVDFDIETISQTEPTVKYQIDTSLPVGTEQVTQKGANGTVVNVYKILKQNGKIISKTLLSQDTYNSLEKIILKND